jgi:hypothetical protein
MGCLSIAIACGFSSACAEGSGATDVGASRAQLQSTEGAAGQAANSAPPADQTQSDEALLSAANKITYYDGCKKVHQACRCQNTGWAGYCGTRIDWPDIIVLCVCN